MKSSLNIVFDSLQLSSDMDEHPNDSIDTIFNCVIPYINDGADQNSVSLVCRKWYELDCMTRKHVTIHLFYSPTPSRLVQRFPFLESLTLKVLPTCFTRISNIDINPWIQEISISYKFLKELHIRLVNVCDSDLELLTRTRGKDLRVLQISKCKGLSTDGLMHIGKYCNDLRTFFLEDNCVGEKDGKWLHELALHSMRIESLNFRYSVYEYDDKDLTLLAKNCSQSLVSLKITGGYLDHIVDVFSYAIKLEIFVGDEWDYFHCEDEESVGLRLPPDMCYIGLSELTSHLLPLVLPFAHQRCPNLEVLYISDMFADRGLQVIVTDISNETMECIGTHLKNLRDFHMILRNKDSKTTLPLDNGIRAILIGCSKLERLRVSFWSTGLTDVGLGYIGKYGHNLRYLSLSNVGESDAGLVELSMGCPKLRELEMRGCCDNCALS
ncbi:coronatine-insensitive protein 1-like protein, partial [Tanacetum coccineum]